METTEHIRSVVGELLRLDEEAIRVELEESEQAQRLVEALLKELTEESRNKPTGDARAPKVEPAEGCR